MRFSTRILGSLALVAMTGAFFASGAPSQAGVTGIPSIQIKPSMAQSSGAGWQGVATFSFQTGTTSIFLHADCPSNVPIVTNGAYALNSTGQTSQVYVAYDAPRIDESPPNYNEWGFHFYWPAGSPAGTTGVFNIFCQKKE